MPTTKEILIVEDDIILRQQISKLLSKAGYITREASNGLEGLKAIREGIPDLLISDLAMPVMDGIEFVEEMVNEYPMLAIIILSDGNSMAEVAKMLRYGVKDFLFKPIKNNKAFLQTVTSVIEDSQFEAFQDNDFCQQWFNVSQYSEEPVTRELSRHLDELLAHPGCAYELLQGLMPESNSTQGNWKLCYQALQSTDVCPIIFDYTWMLDGKMYFYLIDSASAGDNAITTTLLIRAFFNAYLRSEKNDGRSFLRLLHTIEHAIKDAHYASPIRAIFGMLTTSDNKIYLFDAGLTAMIDADKSLTFNQNKALLGAGAVSNKFLPLSMNKGNLKLSLSDIGLNSFQVVISRN